MALDSLEQIAQRTITCRRCDAAPPTRCRTKSGRLAGSVHSVRMDAAIEAWRVGYTEGGEGMRDLATRFLRRKIDTMPADRPVILNDAVLHELDTYLRRFL